MQLRTIEIARSPQDPARVRLQGEVVYGDSPHPERYWFDVAGDYAQSLSTSGDPWLVCLLPLAVTLGEPLRLCAPVDRTLYQHMLTVMNVWKGWYPALASVAVEAQLDERMAEGPKRNNAAFFTGGVDSFFTVLRHASGSETAGAMPLDDLVTVWGFDIPLSSAGAFQRKREALERAARALNTTLLDVATNLRTTRWSRAAWGPLSFGCALAAVAHAMGARFQNVMIASGRGYHDLSGWGSHVVTDPLFGSRALRIIHDGAEFSRVDKLTLIAESPLAMRHLHVCYKLQNERNCGICFKCQFTMAVLHLLGALDRCRTFNATAHGMADMIPRWFVQERNPSVMMLRELALRRGRQDIARAIESSLNRSRRLNRYLIIPRLLRKSRYGYRLGVLLERQVLQGSVPTSLRSHR